ncbi:hypothetical protein XELAEV_18001626mg [Xenopus laevis]|nr:hypothetical protein XELAEV_18001626mg [Xenopus laevis]
MPHGACYFPPSSLSPSDYTVRLGAYQLSLTSPHEITSRVDSINVNSMYDGSTNRVCLPSTSDNFTEGMECWVTGWGRISSELNLPNPQKSSDVMTPLISTATCNQIADTSSSCSLNKSTLLSGFLLCIWLIAMAKD